MKKSLENYNNIRLSKRVKSNEDKSMITSPSKAKNIKDNVNTSNKSDSSLFDESINSKPTKKLIFKSKASSAATAKVESSNQKIAKTAESSTNLGGTKAILAKNRIKLKRSMSDDDDDDDEDQLVLKSSDQLDLLKSSSKILDKNGIINVSTKVKLKPCEQLSDNEEEICISNKQKEKNELSPSILLNESKTSNNINNNKKVKQENISSIKLTQNTNQRITRSSPPDSCKTIEAKKAELVLPVSHEKSQKKINKSPPKKTQQTTVTTTKKIVSEINSTSSNDKINQQTQSFTCLIQKTKNEQSPQSVNLNETVLTDNLISSDSDTESCSDDDNLNKNFKLNHKKKFFKIIKSSSISKNNLEEGNTITNINSSSNLLASTNSCASSLASSSSNSNVNVLQKRKIFSSKRTQNESTSFGSSFKLNFTQNTNETNNSNLHTNATNSISSGSRSSSVNSLCQEKNENLVKTLFNSDNTSNSNTEGEEEADVGNGCLRNARKAYECENLGEAQAFQDDLFYLMDGLKSKYKLSERCLCAIKLAEQCLSSEFRMSLRSSTSGDYLNKIFRILNDSNKYKSLALCTSLIMFALTQDKLKIIIDKSSFYLIVSILNMNTHHSDNNFFSCFLNDSNTVLSSPPSSSIQSSKSVSPSQISLVNLNVNNNNLACEIDYDENDDIVYKRIYARCKNLYKQLINLMGDSEIDAKTGQLQNDSQNDSEQEIEENDYKNNLDLTLIPKNSNTPTKSRTDSIVFNSHLLALECILNLNLNKQHESLSTDWYKNELRELNVLEKLLMILKSLINQFQKEKQKVETKQSLHAHYEHLNKYAKYLNLIITVTQHPVSLNSSLAGTTKITSNNTSEMISSSSTNQNESVSFLNQNYLIDYQKNFLLELIKESLSLFYGELEEFSNNILNNINALPSQQQSIFFKSSITNSIKQTFLVMINITHKNQKSSQKFVSDFNLVDLIYKCIASYSNSFDESEQFDILIMSLVIILNIFETNFKQDPSLNLIKHVKSLNKSSFDIIIDLFKKKEHLVYLAETDQEKELKELNSQIEAQNVDNINSTFMNSIGKAGKHMEDHIIAAHSALVIGYMIITDHHLRKNNLNNKKITNHNRALLINLEETKLHMKDHSFRHMAQIIRKFLVFMKIMKCSGFSDDNHIQCILKQLEEI